MPTRSHTLGQDWKPEGRKEETDSWQGPILVEFCASPWVGLHYNDEYRSEETAAH
ncbi:hypothetical protein GCM10025784_26690 [Citricoccus nitrophenolicus]